MPVRLVRRGIGPGVGAIRGPELESRSLASIASGDMSTSMVLRIVRPLRPVQDTQG
jgi:hypothetical protein